MRSLIFLLFFWLITNLLALTAYAQLRVDITRGDQKPLKIALFPFQTVSKKEKSLAQDILSIVQKDLARSGLFLIAPQNTFPESKIPIDITPSFSSWRVLRTEALMHGTLERQNGQNFTVSFRLWDIFLQKQLKGFSYNFNSSDKHRIAHIIADHIYSRLTGESGYFNSQIVYVAEIKKLKNKITKHLALMDADGENRQIFTNDDGIPQTPRFSPLAPEIVYSRIYKKTSDIYWLDLVSGRQLLIRNNKKGLFFSPRFSHDGNRILMARAFRGNTEIWEFNLASQNYRRLTFHSAIDLSASYAPDGSRIVFNSDRGGSLQLYTMTPKGKDIKRISFCDGRYSTPVWSPRGDLIAFVKQFEGNFHLGIMTPDGKNERLLSKHYFIDSPDWAPNGRVLVFYTKRPAAAGKKSRKQIYTIDITGRGLYHLKTVENAAFPSWSSLRTQ